MNLKNLVYVSILVSFFVWGTPPLQAWTNEELADAKRLCFSFNEPAERVIHLCSNPQQLNTFAEFHTAVLDQHPEQEIFSTYFNATQGSLFSPTAYHEAINQ